jgi:hypothetical protein
LSRLANLGQTIQNAVTVLRKPEGNRWNIFYAVNGKLTAPDIAKKLKISRTIVASELTYMYGMGLLDEVGKRLKAPLYARIPELRNTNLRPYFRKNRKKVNSQISKPDATSQKIVLQAGTKSRYIQNVIDIGKKYEIENIDQNWVDALVMLNFIETTCTKFLMDHGYSEEDATKIKWDEKLDRIRDKLYEEAGKKGKKPRTSILGVLKSYREQRNTLDHQAHVLTATVEKEELNLLLSTVKVFVKEIFERHKEYCSLI